jgi:hypothetical protein
MNKKIKTEIAIGIILIVSAIVGGLIWLGVNQQNKNIDAISSIKQSIKKTQSEQRQKDMQFQPSLNEKESDNQIVDTTDNTNNVSPTIKPRFSGSGCYAKESDGTDNLMELSKNFNQDDPDSKILYTNQEKGISFKIPYNAKWGNKNCKVESYIEFTQPNGVFFLGFGIPHAWVGSDFSLYIITHRKAEDIINENNDSEPNPNLRRMNIGNNSVVAYESYGMGVESIYEIIGTKYNYQFSRRDSELDKKKIKKLEEIIKEVKIK